MASMMEYKEKFEHFDLLMDVVIKKLDLAGRFVRIYEYKAPFEFYSRNSDGTKKLCLSATHILESCNSIICDDELFEDEQDLIDEITEAIGESTLSVVVDLLKHEHDCIMLIHTDAE